VNNKLTEVELFCDGACSGNPGPGGYGTILRCRGQEKELSGSAAETTNNRMELTAALAGLQQLTRPCRVTVTTDSQYLVKGMTEWLAGWQRNGWKNSKKEPVLNRDLWEQLGGGGSPASDQLAGGCVAMTVTSKTNVVTCWPVRRLPLSGSSRISNQPSETGVP